MWKAQRQREAYASWNASIGSALRAKSAPIGRRLSNHIRVTGNTRPITPPRPELLCAALWVYVPAYMADGRKLTEKEQREQRLQEALRENLKRRKVQAR